MLDGITRGFCSRLSIIQIDERFVRSVHNVMGWEEYLLSRVTTSELKCTVVKVCKPIKTMSKENC